MKAKRILLPALILVLIFSVFSFGGCKRPPAEQGEKTVTVIVLDGELQSLFEKQVKTEQLYLYGALLEIDELEITSTVSMVGAYVTGIAIGEIEESEWGDFFSKTDEIKAEGNSFIAIYHDIDKLELKMMGVDDLQYNNKNYFSSGLGISSLPLYDGQTYIFTISTF